MGNCLVTQYKREVSNNELRRYETVEAIVKAKDGAVENDQLIVVGLIPGMVVSVEGGGYMAESYAGLNNPLTRFTSYTATDYVYINLYVANIDSRIYIKSKYSLIYLYVGAGSIITPVLNDLEYCIKLSALRIIKMDFQCQLEKLTTLSDLGEVQMYSPNVIGELKDIGNLIKLSSVNFNGCSVGGDIIDFVSAQVANGRSSITASSPISMYSGLSYLTFNGNTYSENTGSFLTWQSASKIALYAGGEPISSCTKVYTYGYTQQEAEAAFPGKTIIRVDA